MPAGPLAADEGSEIAALAEHPQVRAALDHLVEMGDELLVDLVELTEIPAPPFGEGPRGERFAEMLSQAGLTDITIDEAGNVIGRRPGRDGRRVIALTAHLDTVFPIETDVTVHIDGDTYTAPGIGDNTRGVVVLLGILRALEQAEIDTAADVLFIGNTGEEGLGDLRGVKHLFRDGGPQIDAMIAIDGGSTGRLVYGGVGSHRYRITFKGPGGHSWGAFGTANPHHALGRAIEEFMEAAPEVTADGEKTSFNVGRIGGGTSINSVPFESWMEVDMRSGDQDKLDAIDSLLQAAVQDALREENASRTRGEPLTVDVEQVGKRPAAKGNREADLVQRAAAAIAWAGLEPDYRISSTDANHPISIGVPAITLSRGGISRDAHAPAESWENKDSHLALHIALLTLLAEADMLR
ncbi:MAG: M20/M25/M40 family metallo-hydrolase [Gammaproteobacteria bacterium]|nr:M20/M25/M40 family metallo-hydrolase [Gammaproteobacteria bacterium]MBT8093302.1 M20/M25/M40 family metallo-hydrolase [Gammaproteobacteria bacterium]MBT8106139.1 M20/M25/M40 family metallo-hydrolase [Gammaproteobacteria bacterium]NNK26153.1 M20/M25/M40 family metallo-hydrolase [Woeseiaceae bacterium]